MSRILYPAVMERGEGSTVAIWLPDWPGVVAASLTQGEAIAKAERALAVAAEEIAEQGRPPPTPSNWDDFDIPQECDLVVRLAIGLTPPDLSERVNVYLPKSLIEQVDRAAADWGMTRSSFFGFAVKRVLSDAPEELWKAVTSAVARRR